MLVTACLRLAIFPLVLRVQRNNTRMKAIQPQSSALMQKLTEAKSVGDQTAVAVYSQQLSKMWKDNNCTPWRAMVLPLVQMPLFISFFFAVRGLASLPVPQMKEGGLWWFEDLTVADPYYILPVASMLFQLAIVEVSRCFAFENTSSGI